MTYSITIYIDNGGSNGGPGYAYVSLSDGLISNYYGYYPKGGDGSWSNVVGPGEIRNNDFNRQSVNGTITHKKTFELNKQQYENGIKTAEEIQKNPKTYNGLESNPGERNCVGNADVIAKSVGISQGIGNLFSDSELDDTLAGAGGWADLYYGDSSLVEAIAAGMVAVGAIGLGGVAIAGIGISSAIASAAAGAVTLTPIALDLNANGRIDTLSANTTTNKVFFDIDNDNFREKTSWIQGGDGWLAMDRNGYGKITNQRELFGDSDGIKHMQN